MQKPILESAKEKSRLKMPNPYDPKNPVKPNYFGGREPMVSSFKEILAGALKNNQSSGILVYGHRGVGKTSLLQKLITIALGNDENRSEVLIIHRRLSSKTNSESLYNILLEELNSKIRERKNFIEMAKQVGKNVAGVRVFGLDIDIQKEKISLSPFQVWKLALKSLKDVACIMIAIDEADELEITALGELKTLMEEMTKIKIILAISGGIEFEERLVGEYSPIARIFSGASYNLSRFECKETEEVLRLPLQEEETAWAEDAIKSLHQFTLGYPYLVQCLAKASYKENNRITKEMVEGSIETAVNIGKPWLGHEVPNASNNDIRYFLKIVELNKEMFQNSEMASKNIPPPYVGRLVKLGVIKKISYGTYKLEKSPIVAIFEKLRRGL